MAEQFVAKSSEIKDGERRIVFIGEHEIGVFKEKGEYFAYSNFCLHQGGPACEGLTIAKVEERIMPDKTSRGMYFSDTELHFVCPWHGMEYDMKTGECVIRPQDEAAQIQDRPEGRRHLCRRVRRRRPRLVLAAPQGGPPPPSRRRRSLRRRSSAAEAAANGDASAEATQLAATIERDLRDGKLDTLTPQAFQALMAALCKSYGTQLEAGADFLPRRRPSAREPDRNHDNDERASEGRQSGGLRARHVAELDGPLSARAAEY